MDYYEQFFTEVVFKMKANPKAMLIARFCLTNHA